MFDALNYLESLTNIGVPENQAKLQAKALSKAFESNDLATKVDIAELKVDIAELKVGVKADIIALKISTKADIADLKAEMSAMELRVIKWQIGGISLVIAAIKFL